MKQTLLCFLVLCAISCTKENVSETIVGNWTIVERKVGTGSGYSSAPIVTQRTIRFNTNGTCYLEDSDTTNFLHGFNRYQITSDQRIQFYSTSLSDSMIVDFKLENNLSLFYPARCGYHETFTRL